MSNDLIQRLRARCATSEQCLPDAPYREMLTALHGEMLGEIERLTAELQRQALDYLSLDGQACELMERAEKAEAERDAACKTVSDMHAAAMGVTGSGPRRGVVEDVADLRAERDALFAALNAMLTHMGMDEDEWNKPTFDQARAALAARKRHDLHHTQPNPRSLAM